MVLFTCDKCGNEVEVFYENFDLVDKNIVELETECQYCNKTRKYEFMRIGEDINKEDIRDLFNVIKRGSREEIDDVIEEIRRKRFRGVGR